MCGPSEGSGFSLEKLNTTPHKVVTCATTVCLTAMKLEPAEMPGPQTTSQLLYNHMSILPSSVCKVKMTNSCVNAGSRGGRYHKMWFQSAYG